MNFLFLDDAKQAKPKRERMGSLVGVGGFYIDANDLRSTADEIERHCAKIGLGRGDMFKWSPRSGDKFRGIVGQDRVNFFLDVLTVLKTHKGKAIVSVCDTTKRRAVQKTPDAEVDALVLTLERFHTSSKNVDGFVVLAKPSGGRKDENKMLSDCYATIEHGTDYVDFSRFAQPPVIMPSVRSRLLQAADLIVSVCTAMVSGNDEYAKTVFTDVEAMLAADWRGLKGSTGLKVHPSILYKNLYYWILKEDFWASGSTGFPLPVSGKPFFADPYKY